MDMNTILWAGAGMATGFLVYQQRDTLWNVKKADHGGPCQCYAGDNCQCETNHTEKNAEVFNSEINQDVHAAQDGELARLNPTIVEGAEDIMGAENFDAQGTNCDDCAPNANGCPSCGGIIVSTGSDCVYAQPYNHKCPQVAGYARSPTSPSQGRMTGSMPTNPLYYDGDYASAHEPKVISWYDNFNDYRPQYEFPAPWSPMYNPVEPYRPADKQVYYNDGGY